MLPCVLTIVALLAYLMLTGESAEASGTETTGETSLAQSSGMRRFYLTHGGYTGDGVRTACAQGYHFASLWELIDPSNLKYYTRLGYTQADSGQGPPSPFDNSQDNAWGWVRTGWVAGTGTVQGQANCDAWTSSLEDTHGTLASLPSDWTSGDQDMGV